MTLSWHAFNQLVYTQVLFQSLGTVHWGKFSKSICHINTELHLFAVKIGTTAEHMTESQDTLVGIKVQHHIEITRTKIMIHIHIPHHKVDLQ